MKTAGFVIPMEKEGRELIAALSPKTKIVVAGRTVFAGRLSGVASAIVISGCGKVNSASATQLLIDKFDCGLVVHLGVAGALSSDLKIGDFVIGDEIVEHDYHRKFGDIEPNPVGKTDVELSRKVFDFGKTHGFPVSMGRIVSGNEDVVSTGRRNELLEQFKGVSVDWESCGAALVCNISNVPVVVLRAIVDYAYEHTAHEFRENVGTISARLCEFVGRALPTLTSSPSISNRPEFVKHYIEIRKSDDSHYPGSQELLSIGSPFAKATGLTRLGIHHGQLPPGRRTSWPHAEQDEDEFVYVIEEHPHVWIDGEIYQLNPGDGVGFPCGTGISHTFINNTESDVRLLVVGEASKKASKIFYPLNPERKEQVNGNWWHDVPLRPLGSHNGLPDEPSKDRGIRGI